MRLRRAFAVWACRDLELDLQTQLQLREARTLPIDKADLRKLAATLEDEVSRTLETEPDTRSMHVTDFPRLVRWTTTDPRTGRKVPFQVMLRIDETPGAAGWVTGGALGNLRDVSTILVDLNGSIEVRSFKLEIKEHRLREAMYDLLLHEVTHLLDIYSKSSAEFVAAGDLHAYYNTPAEVAAYAQEIVAALEKPIQQRLFAALLKINQRKPNGRTLAIQGLLQNIPAWTQASPFWTEKNKARVMKKVVTALDVSDLGTYRQDRLFVPTELIETFRIDIFPVIPVGFWRGRLLCFDLAPPFRNHHLDTQHVSVFSEFLGEEQGSLKIGRCCGVFVPVPWSHRPDLLQIAEGTF